MTITDKDGTLLFTFDALPDRVFSETTLLYAVRNYLDKEEPKATPPPTLSDVWALVSTHDRDLTVIKDRLRERDDLSYPPLPKLWDYVTDELASIKCRLADLEEPR